MKSKSLAMATSYFPRFTLRSQTLPTLTMALAYLQYVVQDIRDGVVWLLSKSRCKPLARHPQGCSYRLDLVDFARVRGAVGLADRLFYGRRSFLHLYIVYENASILWAFLCVLARGRKVHVHFVRVGIGERVDAGTRALPIVNERGEGSSRSLEMPLNEDEVFDSEAFAGDLGCEGEPAVDV